MLDYQQLADAIRAASASPLAFAACLVVVFVGLAFSWFTNSEAKLKVGVFAVLLVAAGLLFYLVYVPPAPPRPGTAIDRSNYVVDLQYAGAQEKAARVQAELQRKGWVVYGIEKASNFTPSLVKYGASSNAAAAEALRTDVDGLRASTAPIRFARDDKIKSSHLELWIGLQ